MLQLDAKRSISKKDQQSQVFGSYAMVSLFIMFGDIDWWWKRESCNTLSLAVLASVYGVCSSGGSPGGNHLYLQSLKPPHQGNLQNFHFRKLTKTKTKTNVANTDVFDWKRYCSQTYTVFPKKLSFYELNFCRFATNIRSISSQLAAGFPSAQFGKTFSRHPVPTGLPNRLVKEILSHLNTT